MNIYIKHNIMSHKYTDESFRPHFQHPALNYTYTFISLPSIRVFPTRQFQTPVVVTFFYFFINAITCCWTYWFIQMQPMFFFTFKMLKFFTRRHLSVANANSGKVYLDVFALSESVSCSIGEDLLSNKFGFTCILCKWLTLIEKGSPLQPDPVNQ